MKSIKNIFILGLSFLLSVILCKSEQTILKFGYDNGYPPYEYRDNDTIKGFIVDLAAEIGKEMGFIPDNRAGNWEDMYAEFKKGNINVIAMFYHKNRAKDFLISNSFLNISHTVFYRNDAKPIEKISDLNGKRVLVEVSEIVRARIKELAPDCEIIKVDNPIQAMDLMVKEGYDYAVLPKLMAYHYIKQNHIELLVPSTVEISQNKYCYAFHKNDLVLLQTFNEGLHILQENGKFNQLYVKWFGVVKNEQISISEIIKYASMVLLPLMLVLLIVFLWNRLLKRQVNAKTRQLENELQEKMQIEKNLLTFQFALDHSVDCVFGIDINSNFVYTNNAATQTLGYSKQEFLKMSIGDIDHSFLLENWGAYWDKLKKDGFINVLTLQTRKDKKQIMVEGNVYLLKAMEQDLAFAITRDVSDKYKTEQELKKSESFFRNMFEKSSVIMFIADPDTMRIVDVNTAAVNFYGYSKAEFQNLTIMDLNKASIEITKAKISGSQHNEVILLDISHYLKDGSLREVSISGSALIIDNKEYIFTLVTDNTEKNIALNHLQDSEEKFSKAFLTSPDSININRLKDGVYIDVNESFQKTIGYTREELIGRSSVELNIWKDLADRDKLVKSINETGECIGLEAIFITKQGNEIYGLMSARLIELDGEKCLISITRDITERRKEEIYRQALYQISEAAISSVDFNDLCKQIHEIVAGLMPTINFYIALYDQDTQTFEYPYFVDEFDEQPAPRKRAKGITELVIDTGDTWLVDPNEFYELARVGKVENIGTPSIDWLGSPLKTQDGVIGAIVVQSYTEGLRYNDEHKRILSFVSNQIAMAIAQKRAQTELLLANELLENRVEERTLQLQVANEEMQAQIEERMRIENEIRESEERFRLMADSAPVMIWMTDSSGDISYVNQTWLDFTGKDSNDMTSNSWINNISPEDYSAFIDEFQLCCANKMAFETKARMIDSNGELRFLLFNGKPRIHNNSKFIGFVGSGVDITDMHNALEQEKELNFLKTRFISTVSHEYRTPLTTILTSTYLIDTFIRSGNSSEANKFLERIQNSVKSMTSLLDQVLTISRSDTGKLLVEKTLINPADFCTSFISEIKIIDKDKHNFIINFDPSVNNKMMLDPNLLQQICSNLLTNAIKYSPEKSDITLTVDLLEDKLVFRVKDSGIGIPEEQVTHLFEPFFRASNVGAIQGTGLGLSIVKRCIDLLNGTMSVTSVPNEGTSFEFQIPV